MGDRPRDVFWGFFLITRSLLCYLLSGTALPNQGILSYLARPFSSPRPSPEGADLASGVRVSALGSTRVLLEVEEG